MAISDIFKKEEKVQPKAKKSAAKTVKSETKPAVAAVSLKKDINTAKLMRQAHVTEKAAGLVKINQYVFKVAPNANKNQIARIVETNYKVSVTGVNMINTHNKRKRVGRGIAVKPGFRKAIVSLKAGQTIEIMPK